MVSAVGLLLVHGIGNQAPGVLSREIAGRIRDSGRGQEPIPSPSPSNGSPESSEAAASLPVPHRIMVGAVPVFVAEAHWAPLSHPDNPPHIRTAPYLLRDYLDTVSSAWHASYLASGLRHIARRYSAKRWFSVWGTMALLITGLFLLAYFVDTGEATHGDQLVSLLGVLMAPWFFTFVFYSMRRILRFRSLKLRRAAQARRMAELFVWSLIAYFLAVGQFFLLFLSGQALLYFLAAVVAALGLNYVLALPVLLFRKLGKLFGQMRWDAARAWLHRFVWVMLVLPAHSFAQVTKASGNLFSILLMDRRWPARWSALVSLFGVYVGFLVLMVICELLIIPPLTPVLLPLLGRTGDFDPDLLWGYVVLIPLYAVLVKTSLAGIDLLLDISNYHLASRAERLVYFRPIEQAVESLRRSGCGEVHVLAHSLGSVITYDWMQFAGLETCPISMFHTIGSPLDKFWYIDHSRSERIADEKGVAERLSRGWINYWAYSDPVSGSLGHYGTGARGVHNLRIRKLGWFLVSHTRYWKDPVLIGRLREGIIAAAAPQG